MNSIFDFAQRTYEMEIERKDRINASLSFPAGVVARLSQQGKEVYNIWIDSTFGFGSTLLCFDS